jgi:hypothetical protein
MNKIFILTRFMCIISIFISISACGRFAAPIAPEKVAPQAVENLVAQATDNGLILTWTTPENNRIKKPLRFMDGYSVYRKKIVNPKDVTDDKIEFELLTEIADKAIKDREDRKEQTRELGGITRRVKLDPVLSAVRFEDQPLERGKTYLYKIVPTNQNGVEGEVRQFVSITFRGLESDISLVSAKKLGVDDFIDSEEVVAE